MKPKILEIEEAIISANNTPSIYNESQIFTAGKGTDVSGNALDYATSVVDGQVSVGLKARTLFNYANNGANYANWTIAGAGTTKGASGIHLVVDGFNDISELPLTLNGNKVYTLIFNIKATNTTGTFLMYDYLTGANIILPKSIGINKVKITTQANILTNKLAVVISDGANGEYIDFELYSVPEGDYTTDVGVNQPLLYGVNSTLGASRLKSVGKNLFEHIGRNWTLIGATVEEYENSIDVNFTSNYQSIRTPLKVEANIPYYASCVQSGINIQAAQMNVNGTYLTLPSTFTSIDGNIEWVAANGAGGSGTATFSNIQLEEGTTATTYEPYTESISYIDTGDELRSLPNGVKDEVSVDTGVLTQNISGTITLIADDIYDVNTGFTNVDIARTRAGIDFPASVMAKAKTGTSSVDGIVRIDNKSEISSADIDNVNSIGKFYFGSDKRLQFIVAKGTYGVKQVETATVVGTITTAGNATITVTASGVTSFASPVIYSVAVALNDTATMVAGKIRTALQADINLINATNGYTVGGTGASITLTRNAPLADDTTLNVDINNGTSVGLTASPTSTNTIAGVNGLTAAQTALAGTTLNYQLATPVTTNLNDITPLQCYENGTIMLEPYLRRQYIYNATTGNGIDFEYAVSSIDQIIDKNGDKVTGAITLASNGLSCTFVGAVETDAYTVYAPIKSELSTIPTSVMSFPSNAKAQIEGNNKSVQRLSKNVLDIQDQLAMLMIMSY